MYLYIVGTVAFKVAGTSNLIENWIDYSSVQCWLYSTLRLMLFNLA